MIGNFKSLVMSPFRAMSSLWSGASTMDEVLLRLVGWDTTSGEPVDQQTAMTLSAAYACTRLLSTSGAGLPLNLKRPRAAGGNENAREHPVYRLIHRRPNPRMSSMAFRLYGLAQQINWGDFYCEIARNPLGDVTGLYPIHHSRVSYEVSDDDGSVVYAVANKGGARATILVNGGQYDGRCEMLHIPSIIPRADGIGGHGVITHARNSIGLGLATERHGAAVFRNGCRPLLAIKQTNKRDLDPDQKEVLRKDWLKAMGGPKNVGMPAILGTGMELQPFSWDFEKSQFLESRKYNVEDVARWYGVPPHMIGHLERATFNNIEMQSLEYVTYSLMPWLRSWEENLELCLLTEADLDAGLQVKFNVNGLLRGDSKARGDFYKLLWNLGVLSINEIRELEDLNPIGPDGDKRFVPLNVTTVARAGTEESERQQATMPAPADNEDRSQRQAAAFDVLSDVLKRMWKKEANAARRAAKNATTFLDWLDSFYTSHTATLLEALYPFNRLAAVSGVPIAYPTELVEDSRSRLEEIHAETAAEDLCDAIAAEVDQWTDVRLKETIDSMKERNHAGQN